MEYILTNQNIAPPNLSEITMDYDENDDQMEGNSDTTDDFITIDEIPIEPTMALVAVHPTNINDKDPETDPENDKSDHNDDDGYDEYADYDKYEDSYYQSYYRPPPRNNRARFCVKADIECKIM